MEHPLPSGIFVEMPSLSYDFVGWTENDFDNEIKRLKKRVKELIKIQKTNKNKTLVPIQESDEDDDDIMNDPDVREMVENGEHICHMFDAHCQACEDDEEDEEVRVMTEEEVLNDPEMSRSSAIERTDRLRAHFC